MTTGHTATAQSPNQPDSAEGTPERVTVRTLGELRQKLQEGADAADRGETVAIEDAFAEVRENIKRVRE